VRDPLAVQTRLQLHINELFVLLLELLEEKNVRLDAHLTTTRRTVELFLARLPQHLQEPWTLPAMARECGLGSSAFSDYCSRITNQTPAKYLAHCRLEVARTLLLSRRDLSITDVAFACGFQSSQYLATAFRQKIGQSPRAFRAAHAGL
jgi:AraC family L-rhamnose operon regulatory protein RhaS